MFCTGGEMPYRITVQGVTVECDTADEMLAAVESAAPRTPQSPRVSAARRIAARQATANAEATALIDQFSENARRIIQQLIQNPQGLLTDELAARVELESRSLPPVIRSIRRSAIEANFDEDDFLIVSQEVVDGRPKSRYRLSERALTGLRN